jgi:hypothetical protein
MTIAACPPDAPTPTRGVVVFDAAEFKAAYPAFATVADALLAVDFNIAVLFLNNSCCSVVQDAPTRQVLLYMLTAHIATLLQGANGVAPSGIVGRVDSASEGTVSVSMAYASEMSMSAAYFAQTPYGVMFWQATTVYRSFRYIAPPSNGCVGPFPGNFGPFPRGGGGCC